MSDVTGDGERPRAGSKSRRPSARTSVTSRHSRFDSHVNVAAEFAPERCGISSVIDISLPGAQIMPGGGCQIMLPLLPLEASGGGGKYAVDIPVQCDSSLRGSTMDIQFGVVEPGRPYPLIGASWSSIHWLVQDL